MPRLLQIHEDDLAELERTIPQLGEALETARTRRVYTDEFKQEAVQMLLDGHATGRAC